MQQLWPEKYSPSDFDGFVGNSEILEKVMRWGSEWNKGRQGNPLLLYGPTGIGKTCLALLTAKMYGWDIFELNASDFRSKDVIEKFAGAASLNASFTGKPRLVLLDEVDGLHAVDRGGAAAIVKIIRETKNPLILTANEIYGNEKMNIIRNVAEKLEFRKINYLSIAKRLREILESEGCEFDPEAVKELAKNSAGDFRSSLLDLQTLSLGGEKITMESVKSLGYRERQENIFKVLRRIFKAKTFAEVRKARFQSEVRDDLLMRWIEENIPRQYTKPEDTASAFNMLSRADIFNGRILRRQYWGFKRYSSELMTAGVALSRENDYHDFIMYTFPTILKKLSASRGVRNLKKDMGKKIGKKTHASSREVIAHYLPYLQIIFENKELAPQFTAYFDLNEKEVAFLLGTKPETKKVQKIIEKAEELRGIEMLSKRKPLQAVSKNSLKNFDAQEPEGPSEEETKAAEEKEPEEGHKQTTLF